MLVGARVGVVQALPKGPGTPCTPETRQLRRPREALKALVARSRSCARDRTSPQKPAFCSLGLALRRQPLYSAKPLRGTRRSKPETKLHRSQRKRCTGPSEGFRGRAYGVCTASARRFVWEHIPRKDPATFQPSNFCAVTEPDTWGHPQTNRTRAVHAGRIRGAPILSPSNPELRILLLFPQFPFYFPVPVPHPVLVLAPPPPPGPVPFQHPFAARGFAIPSHQGGESALQSVPCPRASCQRRCSSGVGLSRTTFPTKLLHMNPVPMPLDLGVSGVLQGKQGQ